MLRKSLLSISLLAVGFTPGVVLAAEKDPAPLWPGTALASPSPFLVDPAPQNAPWLKTGLQVIGQPPYYSPVPVQSPALRSPALQAYPQPYLPAAPALDEVASIRAATQGLSSAPAVDLQGMRLLQEGDQGDDVAVLRSVLQARGLASEAASADPTLFDATFAQEVRDAQQALGLNPDGIAGPVFYAALSADGPQMAHEANAWATHLERAAAQARAQGAKRFIVVNLAAYTLWVFNVQTGATELESRVIVGAPHTRSPRMAMDIINLKYNPDWSPPKSIRGARYTPPGPRNPLGQVRFSTNSGVSIYLHDTNNHDLFERETRALSHGCIRVHSWEDLASVLTDTSVEEVLAKTEGNRTHIERIDPVPVVLAYGRTALREGALVRVPDVYGRGDEVEFPDLRGSNVAPARADAVDSEI